MDREFENQVRATQRLEQVVPVSLILIFVFTLCLFGNMQGRLVVVANVPFALMAELWPFI